MKSNQIQYHSKKEYNCLQRKGCSADGGAESVSPFMSPDSGSVFSESGCCLLFSCAH